MGRGANTALLRIQIVIHKTIGSKVNRLDIKLFVNDVLCLCDSAADVLLVAIKYCTGELNENTGSE